MNSTTPNWPGQNANQPNSQAGSAAPFPGSRVSNRPAGTPGNGNGTDRPVTLWGILDAFRRRWIPCVAVAIPAALLVAALAWQSVPAEYESSALLKVHQYQQQNVVETKEKGSDFLMYRDSQINFLKSRPVLTSALRVEGAKETRLLRDVKFPVEWLEEELEVDSDFSAEFIRITLAGEYPEDLAKLVNAVKDVYLDEVVYNERNERSRQLRELKEKYKEKDKNVRQNQERIDRLAEELGTRSSDLAVGAQKIDQMELRALQTELHALETAIRQEEALRRHYKERGLSLDQMNSALPSIGGLGPLESPLAVAPTNNRTASLQQGLLAVQMQIRRFKAFSRDQNHPDLLGLIQQEKQIKKMLQAVPDAADGGPSIAMSKYDYLLKQKEKLELEIRRTEEDMDLMATRIISFQREKDNIQHIVDARDAIVVEIENRELELDAPQRVTVVQEANVPEKRNVKARTQASIMSGLGVFGLIVAGFTMYEWFSHRIGSTSDIANAVNLRLIGTIPSPDKGGLLGLGIFAGKVDYDEWNRAVIESMDVVRTYLMRHIDPGRSASILITSASANEGKTTVSCQLAASLARAGKRVAIVDCDFRRPSAHLILDGRDGPGICEYMRGEVPLKDVYQQTQADGLTFIAAGQVDQVVLQQLSADGGRSLIETLKGEFDFVIIDTSPLLFVAEPSMLAQNADMVLLSTRKDYSRIPYVAQSRDSLRSLQVPLLGAIMVGSDSDFQRQSYGYRQDVQRQTQHYQQPELTEQT